MICNLLSNALRFAKKGDRITLGIAKIDKNILQVNVTNTGSYIEDDIEEKIFNKFFKPKFQGKHMGRNFGLGLTFCKHAVNALVGSIWVESNPEPPETSFFFTIKDK